MSWIVVAVLVLDGLIHLLGFAKAFGYADLPQLTQPISRTWGLAWLAAAGLVLASAVAFGLGTRRFWGIGLVAVVVSQVVIVMAWRDAWAGTLANVLLLVLVGHAWLTEGPRSFQAAFDREVTQALARPTEPATVSDHDLARLPAPVARYLRLAGVVGQPRVASYRVRLRGRIRGAPDSAWMSFTSDQINVVHPPSRRFLMRARMYGLPVQAFHRLVDAHATMHVKAVGLVTVAQASGDVMDRSEAVTLLNDMCLMAPGTLVDPAIRWEVVDATHARAHFTLGVNTVVATLIFGDDGMLANFVSDDRSQLAPDGTSRPLRFSTPVRGTRQFGPLRLAAGGEGRWHPPEGAFAYIDLAMLDIVMNPPAQTCVAGPPGRTATRTRQSPPSR